MVIHIFDCFFGLPRSSCKSIDYILKAVAHDKGASANPISSSRIRSMRCLINVGERFANNFFVSSNSKNIG